MKRNDFVTWLEWRRKKMRLSKQDFALGLGLGKKKTSAASHYSAICSGKPFPRNNLLGVSSFLGVPLEELLRLLPNDRHRTISPRKKFSEDDLLAMAETVRLAGKPLPLGHILDML